MAELKYQPVKHEHEAFLKKAFKRRGFSAAYKELEVEYAIVNEMLSARLRAGLTQEVVAVRMGTTKSAISRLEAAGKHVPSLASLKKYAAAVGCRLRVELVPSDSTQNKVARSRTQQSKAASKKGAATLTTFRTT